MKKALIFLAVICGAAAVGISLWPSPATVDSVMDDFHLAEGRGEDMLMDPLILNADLVKDRVIQDIMNPEMDKRIYAISFLGNEGIGEAMPVLLHILNDESEEDPFRNGALESIFLIDKRRGKRLAGKYSSRQDSLGQIARELLDGSYKPYVRTRFDAWIGRHD